MFLHFLVLLRIIWGWDAIPLIEDLLVNSNLSFVEIEQLKDAQFNERLFSNCSDSPFWMPFHQNLSVLDLQCKLHYVSDFMGTLELRSLFDVETCSMGMLLC